jgi:hypothetical protein
MRHEKHLWFARPASERSSLGQQPLKNKSGLQLGPRLGRSKKLAKGGKMIAPHH